MTWATKLPKKAGSGYLVTTVDGYVRQAEYVETWPKGKFAWLLLPECVLHTNDVIAWQKQPSPYKPKV